MITLNYGELPERKKFCKEIEKHIPYSMELVGYDSSAVIKAVNQGIDSYLEAVFFQQFDAGNKLGVLIKDAGSMHTLLRRLIETAKAKDCELASSIMYTLGYEWI